MLGSFVAKVAMDNAVTESLSAVVDDPGGLSSKAPDVSGLSVVTNTSLVLMMESWITSVGPQVSCCMLPE